MTGHCDIRFRKGRQDLTAKDLQKQRGVITSAIDLTWAGRGKSRHVLLCC